MSISELQARVGDETQEDELIRVEVSCLHLLPGRPFVYSTYLLVTMCIATSRRKEQILTRYNQYISDYD